MSLKNICFDHIKDTFYSGKFGEFNLIIDKDSGFFNATKLCKQGGKEYKNWSRLEKSKLLISVIEKYLGTRIFFESKQNNRCEISSLVSGTYVCKELMLDIASWISPEFYLMCNNLILKHFECDKAISTQKDKIDELIEQNKKLISKMDKVGVELEDTKEQLDEINRYSYRRESSVPRRKI